MKITVDTDTDSHEDIKKIITLLQEMVGSASVHSSSGALNIFGDDTPSASSQENVFNIFEQSSPPSTPSEPVSENTENSVFNIFEQPVESPKAEESSTPTGFFETLNMPEHVEEEKKEEELDEKPVIDIFDLEEY
jgi:hypothetical protein